MTRYPVSPPNWPPKDTATEAAIGQFVIAWGLLELQIDEAIGDIFDVSAPLMWSISANLGTKSKIEIFLSAFHVEQDVFPAAMLERVNKLGHDTATAAGVYRVWVAHGQPFLMKQDTDEEEASVDTSLNVETGERIWLWAKQHARKGGVQGTVARFSPEIFDHHTASVKGLIERWNTLRKDMSRGLGILRLVKRDAEQDGQFPD